MANWFIAPLQFLMGIVRRLLMFLSAKYISLKTASSFGNSERFFVIFRKVMFSDSIVFVDNPLRRHLDPDGEAHPDALVPAQTRAAVLRMIVSLQVFLKTGAGKIR